LCNINKDYYMYFGYKENEMTLTLSQIAHILFMCSTSHLNKEENTRPLQI